MNPEDNGKEPGMFENWWDGAWFLAIPAVLGVALWVFAIIGLSTCISGE